VLRGKDLSLGPEDQVQIPGWLVSFHGKDIVEVLLVLVSAAVKPIFRRCIDGLMRTILHHGSGVGGEQETRRWSADVDYTKVVDQPSFGWRMRSKAQCK